MDLQVLADELNQAEDSISHPTCHVRSNRVDNQRLVEPESEVTEVKPLLATGASF